MASFGWLKPPGQSQHITRHDIIPKQYHKFKKVFLESASEHFPERKKWDHAINLEEDAPTSVTALMGHKCKVHLVKLNCPLFGQQQSKDKNNSKEKYPNTPQNNVNSVHKDGCE
jgi:hypothetical protein